MKNKKIILAVSIMLIFAMMCGTFSVSAAESDVLTTTAPTVSEEENTTESTYDDGYSDGYDDGYYDGYYDGANDAYYEGYYDGSEAHKFPSVFDFIEELRWRLYDVVETIKERLIDAMMVDFPAPEFDNAYLPAENQSTLEGNEAAVALCEKFNYLMAISEVARDPVTVTKTQKVDIEIVDIPGGELAKKIISPVIEEYLVDSSSETYYEKGNYIYNLQNIELSPEGLVSAKETVNEDGTTSYEFVLKEEAAYYAAYETYSVINEGSNAVTAVKPIYHDYCADTLYLNWLVSDLAPLQITGASINYPGATVKATTDAEGRLTNLLIEMPVKGAGEFAAGLVRGDIALEGYRNEGFTFVY